MKWGYSQDISNEGGFAVLKMIRIPEIVVSSLYFQYITTLCGVLKNKNVAIYQIVPKTKQNVVF